MLPVGLDAVYDRILQSIDFEKRGMTVTFLHQSARDYLMESDRMLDLQIPGFSLPQLHEHAAITLIRYIERISGDPGIESKELDDVEKDFPMVIYAVENWGRHFDMLEDITQVMQQGAGFFKGDSKARQVWQNLYDFDDDYEDPFPIPLLHLSARLSLRGLAEWCLRSDGELDLDAEWGTFQFTALSDACQEQEEHIITLLLDAGADAVAARGCHTNALENPAGGFYSRKLLKKMAA
ncbi:ankyrin protein 3 [Fusarium bulbicola]|nr:ankyrin protein 3 [Fusarium bulbicola]